VPREAILEAIQLATAAEVPVIVNPSPFDRHFPWVTVKADTIIVNETEAERLFSLSSTRQRRNASSACRQRDRGGTPLQPVVNETETERLFSLSPNSLNAQCSPWLKAMRAHAIDQLIITRGVHPTLALVEKTDQFLEAPTIKVSPIDTVGAGDTFAGTLTSAHINELPLEQALTRANAAGALATLAPGAQEAMPSAQDMPKPQRLGST
jgi:ribokinase